MQIIAINGIDYWPDYLIMAAAYLILVFTSGKVVNYVLRQISHTSLQETAGQDKPTDDIRKKRLTTGAIVGKCENIIILTFILLEAYTALALVVTAKTLIRKEEIEKNEMYFLAGMMVNVSYSVLTGFILKLILAGV